MSEAPCISPSGLALANSIQRYGFHIWSYPNIKQNKAICKVRTKELRAQFL